MTAGIYGKLPLACLCSFCTVACMHSFWTKNFYPPVSSRENQLVMYKGGEGPDMSRFPKSELPAWSHTVLSPQSHLEMSSEYIWNLTVYWIGFQFSQPKRIKWLILIQHYAKRCLLSRIFPQWQQIDP